MKDNKEHQYLIYGAYGYTGKLIARLAVEKGHKPLLAGRDPEKTKALAEELGLPYVAFDLNDRDKLLDAVSSVELVLHCAGPFSRTARTMMMACIECGAHYLDITGEIEVFELGASLGEQANKAGIILMPGVGFDVVPSDCLAAYLKSQLPDATHLELAFKGDSTTSRGTALTMAEGMHKGGAIRENGTITKVPHAYKVKQLNLDGKERSFVSIPWGDVSTAYYSTDIPNIMVYTGAHPGMIRKMKKLRNLKWFFKLGFVRKYIENKIKKNVKGPTEEMREETRSYLWGEVRNEQDGKSFSAKLVTAEGYKLTAITSVMAVDRILNNSIYPGFKTPSMAFGQDFILEVENTERTDL